MRRPLFYWTVAGLTLLVAALGLHWHWQPERQLRLHQAALLHAYEERDWEDLQKLVAEDYKDAWAQDKATLVQDSQQAFRHFIFLAIEVREGETDVVSGTTEARLNMKGRGSPVAEEIMSRVRELRQPFRFTWRKAGRWPWQWVLVHAEQPELKLDRMNGW